ncbi:MAG TPA: hypothetical protein VJ997_06435, partial [Longimicrobiales bacterium]|nr:hypothetical protein [Longimicrobiales bacterium]
MNSYFRRTVGDIASRVPKRYRNIAAAAAVVLAALAGGSVMLTQDATGKITARAVLDVQPKPEAVELEYTPDAVFRPGGLYDLLPPLSHEALVGAQKWPGDPWDTAFSFGYKSPKIVPAPASMSHVSYVANNAAAPWGEPPAHGPLWGARAYNVGGVITDLTISRVGDWSNGR